jgi:ABC-type bacteriocin/lantibiotic exporter with double-glycine peptidase domain
MDCGPAALLSLLRGFRLHADYDALREACQTDVDGTSIDALEVVAREAGLDVEQTMVPVDHLLLPEARSLPAVVVVDLPGGLTHFVVVWRAHLLGGPLDRRGVVQVMDPGAGRRWVTLADFLDELHVHAMPVPAAAWRAFAGSEEFRAPLTRRLCGLGAVDPAALFAAADADPSWRALGALDAAARMAGHEADGALRAFAHDAAAALHAVGEASENPIPRRFWSVRDLDAPPDDAEAHVAIVGAVALRARGRLGPAAPSHATARRAPPKTAVGPARQLWRLLREDGALTPAVIAASIGAATLAALAESLLFRALFELSHRLGAGPQRLIGFAAVGLFLATVLALEYPLHTSLQRVGRRLEGRLRVAFFTKIPRLGDRYFRSRPTFDLAERAHAVHQLRALPALAGQLLRAVASLVATGAGVAWLAPRLALPVAVAVLAAVAVPLAAQRPLAELDLRFRAHGGALGRFYLDALLGLAAVRTHGAERAIRREHESLLVEWARTARALQRAAVGLEGAAQLAGAALGVGLLVGPFADASPSGGALLLAYWALRIPALGAEVSQLARQYPDHRAVALRLLEPLGAPDDAGAATPDAHVADGRAVTIALDGVTVRASGQSLLDAVSVTIAAGEHVAVVGASGAGKSTLVGLLLGWHAPAAGSVTVDGEALVGARLARLRRETAWVDPDVSLWNRSLLDNLRYGSERGEGGDFGDAVERAGLRPALVRLPDGMQTALGEGGALVSGGEGQRVRLARASLRAGARLALLDEPFRGLDRGQRRELLGRARDRWRDATLLCVTHDVGETLGFPRVIVVEGGRIVEDGHPAALAARADGPYRALLDAEEAVRVGPWSDPAWRRLRMEDGALTEAPRAGKATP